MSKRRKGILVEWKEAWDMERDSRLSQLQPHHVAAAATAADESKNASAQHRKGRKWSRIKAKFPTHQPNDTAQEEEKEEEEENEASAADAAGGDHHQQAEEEAKAPYDPTTNASQYALKVSAPKKTLHKIHVDSELVWTGHDWTKGGIESFQINETMGQGAFGKVSQATHRSGFQLAIKEIDLSILDKPGIAGLFFLSTPHNTTTPQHHTHTASLLSLFSISLALFS